MFKLSVCNGSTELEIPSNICIVCILCLFILMLIAISAIFFCITKNPELLINLINSPELKVLVAGVLIPKH